MNRNTVRYFSRPMKITSLVMQDSLGTITGERKIGLVDCNGHFPGLPILPGVFQIGMAARLIQAAFRENGKDSGLNLIIKGIKRYRFKRPVLPGDRVVFQCEISESGKAVVTVSVDGEKVSGGNIEFILNNRKIIKAHQKNAAADNLFMLHREQIDSILPHRSPMAHLDAADIQSAGYAIGLKSIRDQEPFLVDQVLAPEIIPEALAQLGALTLLSQMGKEEREKKVIFFAGIDIELFSPVFSGEGLFLEATLGEIRRGIGKGKVRANTASSGTICEGELMFAVMDR